MLPQKGKSAIVVEMSPLIKAKPFATHTGSLTNFGEFAVLVYYEVSRKGQDLVEDKVHSTYLKEILLISHTKWLRVSSKTTKTRMN